MREVETRIRIHDRYQLEFKLNYPIEPGERRTRYRFAVYIFVPQSLGINRFTYEPRHFYRDLQNYIRLKTPEMSPKDLCRRPNSPLKVMQRLLAEGDWRRDPEKARRLVNSFKFLRAILKSAIRDELEEVVRQLPRAQEDPQVRARVLQGLRGLCDQVQAIVAAYRDAQAQISWEAEQVAVGRETVGLAYRLTDEALSLLVERSFIQALRLLRRLPNEPEVRRTFHHLSECAESELRYRKERGYPSILSVDSRNEEYMFRAAVLKKYTSSVLFLSRAIYREGTTLEHLMYAVAAGISMVFATWVAFYFQQRYGNFTMPFFAALVVGYMFKDRIKELGRAAFARLLRRYLFDQRIDVRTLDGQHRLGYVREKVHFVPEAEVPPEVMRARNRQVMTELDNDGQGEQILRYVKEVILYNDAFERLYPDMPRFTGLVDIMRYDIRPYLYKMDNPIQRIVYVEQGRLVQAKAHRMYTLNLIFATEERRGGPTVYERTRALLSRKGLGRIEVFE